MTELDKYKKDVYNYWLERFPGLRAYSNGKFYAIMNPFLIGIELVKLPRTPEYRPHFVMYPLFRGEFKECLKHPDLLIEIYKQTGRAKGLQHHIAYNSSIDISNSAIEDVKLQIGFDFSVDISIDEIERLIDTELRKGYVIAGLKQPDYYKLKYYMNLYISVEDAQDTLAEIEKASHDWDFKRFEEYYGDYLSWINSLKGIRRESLIEVVKANSGNPKLSKLNRLQLIDNKRKPNNKYKSFGRLFKFGK